MLVFAKSVLLASSAALAIGLVSVPALAVPMKVVLTGTVIWGYDNTNEFGLGASANIIDQPYVMTLVYDPATPGISRTTSVTEDDAKGGAAYGI